MVVEGISHAKAEEMTVEKTFHLCRAHTRFDLVKSVLASSKFECPNEVIAKMITENNIINQKHQVLPIKRFNKNHILMNTDFILIKIMVTDFIIVKIIAIMITKIKKIGTRANQIIKVYVWAGKRTKPPTSTVGGALRKPQLIESSVFENKNIFSFNLNFSDFIQIPISNTKYMLIFLMLKQIFQF